MNKSATIKSSTAMGHAGPKEPQAPKAGFSKAVKVIIGTGIGALVLGGLIIAAMPGPGATKPPSAAPVSSATVGAAGSLSAFTTKYNFGSISMAAGKVTHRYAIRNTGTAPVLIRKMYTSCMCTTAALVKAEKKFGPYGMIGHGYTPVIDESMRPGEEAMVDVVFDPAAHGPAGIGPTDRVVTIENNGGRPLELAFTANVTP